MDAFRDGDPADTQEAIMRATYRALLAHGYADLTIQHIGDEFEKSKSLLYHHYDGKDELLLDFLEAVLERFEAAFPGDDAGDPVERLETVLAHGLPDAPADEHADLRRAVVTLRAQAAHDPAYREHFARSDRVFRDRVATVVAAGVEDGTFRDVDPEAVADLVVVASNGALLQGVTGDGDGVGPARETLAAALLDFLEAPDE